MATPSALALADSPAETTKHCSAHAWDRPAHLSAPLPAILKEGPLRVTPQDGLVLIHGHPAALRLGHYAAAAQALAGEPVLFLDGAQAFDPFVISRIARDTGAPPRALLAAIHVSRAFTCQQMVRLVTERLAAALTTYRNSTVILAGPLETFYEQTVPAEEARRQAQVLFAALRQLTGQGLRLLCLCPSAAPGRREHLLETLRLRADRVVTLSETTGGLLLREKREGLPRFWRIPREIWERL
jgi:hypothetical protein